MSRPMPLIAVIEKDRQTGLFIGSVPGLVGAHAFGHSIDEMRSNLEDVLVLLRTECELSLDSECIGTIVVSA